MNMEQCLRQNCELCTLSTIPSNHNELVSAQIFQAYTDKELFHYVYGQRLHRMRKGDVEIMRTIGQGASAWHNPRAFHTLQHAEADSERWQKFGLWMDETIQGCPD